MALLTMGTTAQTTLKAMKFAYAATGTYMADLASLEALMQDDQTPGSGMTTPSWGSRVGALDTGNGQLFLPGNRGVIVCLPGDYIGVDTQTGFPFVISAAAAAGAGWVHT